MKMQKHEPFQFGTNPMKMTAFEKSLVEKEVQDRRNARRNYVYGTQGRDGGCIPGEQFAEYGPELY